MLRFLENKKDVVSPQWGGLRSLSCFCCLDSSCCCLTSRGPAGVSGEGPVAHRLLLPLAVPRPEFRGQRGAASLAAAAACLPGLSADHFLLKQKKKCRLKTIKNI